MRHINIVNFLTLHILKVFTSFFQKNRAYLSVTKNVTLNRWLLSVIHQQFPACCLLCDFCYLLPTVCCLRIVRISCCLRSISSLLFLLSVLSAAVDRNNEYHDNKEPALHGSYRQIATEQLVAAFVDTEHMYTSHRCLLRCHPALWLDDLE
jgi:hypothetical protein